jgi:transcriptional repressor NF-X1
MSWAQEQERELRLFAADDEARRMRFKPMRPNRRAFLHAVAEDFGFDSESIDPEPHRHVCIFKTPKFVKAPMKTLTDCVRIRARTAAPAATSSQSQSLSTDNVPFNAFLLTGPRFALTVEELSAAIAAVKTAKPDFSVEFLPSEEVVLKPKHPSETSSASVESSLKALKPDIADAVLNKKMAASLKLCAVDPSLNILRRETADASSSGWSLVAARAAGPKAGTRPVQTPPLGGKTTFTVLSKTRVQPKQPKPVPVEVADDWEAEMDKEEREAAASGSEASDKVEVHDPEQGEQATATVEQEATGSETQPVAETS